MREAVSRSIHNTDGPKLLARAVTLRCIENEALTVSRPGESSAERAPCIPGQQCRVAIA